MDDRLFDEIGRAMAATKGPRRLGLRLLAGALLGGPLAHLGLGAVDAACAKPGRPCGRGKRCCRGAACRRGKCRCKAGLRRCSGRCVDVATDLAHCGACDVHCISDEVCAGGACCDASLLCHGACVDFTTDPNHCGGCDHGCGPGRMCQAGACVGACPPGQSRCGSLCFDTSSDDNHCGSCFNPCPSTKTCQGGVCVNRTCPAGENFCAGNTAKGCNGGAGCVCNQTLAGATRCGKGIPGGTCGECTTDAQCEAVHGSGAYCAKMTGPSCTCPSSQAGRCNLPC